VKAINWASQQDLLRSELLGISPVLLYVITRGRNAWHSTWVENYSGPTALIADFAFAAELAEKRRKQGSVFYIEQVPGLLLKSPEAPIALVEFHSSNCFGTWDVERAQDRLELGTPIAAVLNALGPHGMWRGRPPSEHSFISGIADWQSLTPLPPRTPMKRWTSESLGRGYRLNWNKYPSRYSRQGINRIVKAFELLNPERDRAAAARKYQDVADQGIQRAKEEAERARDELAAYMEQTIAEALAILDALPTGWDEPPHEGAGPKP
jgi:hypothetical protein